MKKKSSIFFIAAVLLAFMKGANAGTATNDASLGATVRTPVISTDVGATADTRARLNNDATGGVLARTGTVGSTVGVDTREGGASAEADLRAQQRSIERTRGNVSVDADTDASLHSRIRDDANDSVSSKLKTRTEVNKTDHGTRNGIGLSNKSSATTDGIGLKSKSTVGVGAKVD